MLLTANAEPQQLCMGLLSRGDGDCQLAVYGGRGEDECPEIMKAKTCFTWLFITPVQKIVSPKG